MKSFVRQNIFCFNEFVKNRKLEFRFFLKNVNGLPFFSYILKQWKCLVHINKKCVTSWESDLNTNVEENVAAPISGNENLEKKLVEFVAEYVDLAIEAFFQVFLPAFLKVILENFPFLLNVIEFEELKSSCHCGCAVSCSEWYHFFW